jgi:hypothetical protein
MAFTRLKSYAGSAGNILKALSLPVETLTTSILSHKGVQLAKELEDSLIKESLKHSFSSISSTISMFSIALSDADLICNLADTWSQLTPTQRNTIFALAIFSVLATIGPVALFGVAEQTMVAGASASTGVLTSAIANQLTLYFAKKNERDFSLLNEGSSVTYTSPSVLR